VRRERGRALRAARRRAARTPRRPRGGGRDSPPVLLRRVLWSRSRNTGPAGRRICRKPRLVSRRRHTTGPSRLVLAEARLKTARVGVAGAFCDSIALAWRVEGNSGGPVAEMGLWRRTAIRRSPESKRRRPVGRRRSQLARDLRRPRSPCLRGARSPGRRRTAARPSRRPASRCHLRRRGSSRRRTCRCPTRMRGSSSPGR
jgi:hypothetical protein